MQDLTSINQTISFPKIMSEILKRASNPPDAWHVIASTTSGRDNINIQANAYRTFKTDCYRELHVGFHASPGIKDWQEAVKVFSYISNRYINAKTLDASIYVGHPETNNGLTVEVKPYELLGIRNVSGIQVNQIIGGRGAHSSHWRSGAKIHKMPTSAQEFTGKVLDLLKIKHTQKKDTFRATYIQWPTTSVRELLETYCFAISQDREINLNLRLYDKNRPYDIQDSGSIVLSWRREKSYLGVSFGKSGSSSWDTSVPVLSQEKIVLLEKIIEHMTNLREVPVNWQIRQINTEKNRGKL